MKNPGNFPAYPPNRSTPDRILKKFLAIATCVAVAGCLSNAGLEQSDNGPFAPGVDINRDAQDGVEVGHRLMAAGEYELATEAFARAALADGFTPEIMLGMGTANLGLGRLGQAEDALRQLVATEPEWPEAWNNLGVVLMERGKTAEAEQVFKKAFALDNGQSDSIRDNLRIALAKSENPANTGGQQEDYKLVRRGGSDFLIRETP
ncbi:MAG: tetratricopeptide repeat protein [Paracoccaceae bacterium]